MKQLLQGRNGLIPRRRHRRRRDRGRPDRRQPGRLGGKKSGGGGPPATAQIGRLRRRRTSSFQGIPQHGNVLGKPNAPVTMVEFADIQCPYCAQYRRRRAADDRPRLRAPGEGRSSSFTGMAFVGPESETASAHCLRCRAPEPAVERARSALPEPGSRELGLGERRLLRSVGDARARHSTWTRCSTRTNSSEVNQALASGDYEAQKAARQLDADVLRRADRRDDGAGLVSSARARPPSARRSTRCSK